MQWQFTINRRGFWIGKETFSRRDRKTVIRGLCYVRGLGFAHEWATDWDE